MRTIGGWTARPTSTKSPRRCANGGGKDRSPAIASVNGGDPTSSCLAELEFESTSLQQRVCELSVPLRSVMRAHPAPVRMHRPTRPGLLALAFDYGCSTLLFVLLCGAGCGARPHGPALPSGGPSRTINCPRSPHQPVAG